MDDLSIGYLLKLLFRRIWLALLTAVVCAALAFGISRLSTPIYAADASLFVTNGGLTAVLEDEQLANTNGYLKSTDFSASFAMLRPCADLLETPALYQSLAAVLPGEYTEKQLHNAVSLSIRSDDSLFIDIQARDSDPASAVRIANEFANAAPEYITEKLPYARIIVAEQATQARKVLPRTMINTLMAAIIGFLIASVVIVLRALLDQTVKTEADFTQNYDIPLLGVVPDFNAPAKRKGGKSV